MEEKEFLEEEYGFVIQGSRESGAGHVLETDQGLFYLFIAPAGYKYKSKMIQRVRKHLGQQQEIGMLKLVKTVRGHTHTFQDDLLYYLYRGIREGELEDPHYACGQSLARFHQATATFTGDKLFLPFSSLGGWPSMWRRKLRRYNEYRDELDHVRADLTKLDEYLLTCYTYVHQLGETAVNYLYAADYDKVVKETAKFGKVAFQNFDQGYMLWNEKKHTWMAGEWNWVLDMRTRDIGQWIKAESRRNGWQDESAIRFLDGYNSVSPLLESEYAIIYGLMLYPGRFLRLVETYHEIAEEERSEVDAEVWRSHLEDELVHMETALRRYPQMIAQQYGTTMPQIDWLWRLEDEKNDRPLEVERSE